MGDLHPTEKLPILATWPSAELTESHLHASKRALSCCDSGVLIPLTPTGAPACIGCISGTYMPLFGACWRVDGDVAQRSRD